MTYVLDDDLGVSEFELQLRYNDHFHTYKYLSEKYEHPYPRSYG